MHHQAPYKMQEDFVVTFAEMNPDADLKDLHNTTVFGLVVSLNQLAKGIYMSMELTYEKMLKDAGKSIPGKKSLMTEIAPTTETGMCAYSEWCIECNKLRWSNNRLGPYYRCVNDDKEFQWDNNNLACNDREPNLCGSGDQLCGWSWKYGSRHACRNVPEAYLVQLPDDTAAYDASDVDTTNSKGVCSVQECEGICVKSWILNGHAPYRSTNYRCLIQDE